jgi:hypothetical protein
MEYAWRVPSMMVQVMARAVANASITNAEIVEPEVPTIFVQRVIVCGVTDALQILMIGKETIFAKVVITINSQI